MLYNRFTGIYKFGNNTYPRRIRRGSNFVCGNVTTVFVNNFEDI